MEPKSSQRRNLRKVRLIWRPITKKTTSNATNIVEEAKINSNFVFAAKTHQKLSDQKQNLVGDRLICLQSASTEFTKSMKKVKKIWVYINYRSKLDVVRAKSHYSSL